MSVMSLGATFRWWAARDPDGVAVLDAHRSITRRELDDESERLARGYRELGVGVDDVVTIGLDNGVGYYVACAAIWKAGGVPNPVSRRLPADELAAIVELADPALLIGFNPDDHPGRTVLPAGHQPDPGDAPPLPDVHASTWKAPVSSGSTGRPKIVYSGTPATVDPEKPTVSYIPGTATQLVSGPLHHSAPFLFSMRGLFVGHTLVVLPRFEPEAALAAIQRHRVTWGLLVPAMMQQIWRLDADVRESYDVSSIESILHLGSRCAPWLKRAWIGWLGPERIVEVYAGTESAGVTVIEGQEWLEHPGSVGRAAPGFTFSVLDEAGEQVPAGTVGELYMRPRGGVGSTYRYAGGEARRSGEWESIGDLGRMDADGYVYLVDRSSDVVTVSGERLYPAEVEQVIDAHESVRSSAVFGLPDEATGERLQAVVDVTDTDSDEKGADERLARELAEWVRNARPTLPPVGIEIVHEPVRDDAGKVRRSALRDARTPGRAVSSQ